MSLPRPASAGSACRNGSAGIDTAARTPWWTGRQRPDDHPTQLDPDLIKVIEQLRRDRKWSARLITVELAERGHEVSTATVQRWLVRLGINRRRDLDPDGDNLREPARPIIAR